MKISGLSIKKLEEIFKLDFKEWKIQNRQERPRTRDYSVNENSLFGKKTSGLKMRLKRLKPNLQYKSAWSIRRIGTQYSKLKKSRNISQIHTPLFLLFLILDNRLRSGFITSENRIDKVDHHCDGTDQKAVRKSGYELWHWVQEMFNSYLWLRIDSRIRYFHRSDRFLLCSGNLRYRDILRVRIFSWNCHDFVWQKSLQVPRSVH